MKIIVTYGDADENGQGEYLRIQTPQYVVKFGDMEPEDASLARDLNCAYHIESMLQEAYTAGVNGEPLEWVCGNKDD